MTGSFLLPRPRGEGRGGARARNARRSAGAALAPFALLALAACAETDPYLKTGMWQPTGANTRNLAAMVENPADLLRGRGARFSTGFPATTPVTLLWAGKPTPLPGTASQAAPTGPAAPAPLAPGGGT